MWFVNICLTWSLICWMVGVYPETGYTIEDRERLQEVVLLTVDQLEVIQ